MPLCTLSFPNDGFHDTTVLEPSKGRVNGEDKTARNIHSLLATLEGQIHELKKDRHMKNHAP